MVRCLDICHCWGDILPVFKYLFLTHHKPDFSSVRCQVETRPSKFYSLQFKAVVSTALQPLDSSEIWIQHKCGGHPHITQSCPMEEENTNWSFWLWIAFSLPQGVQLLKYKLLLVLQLHEAALKVVDFGKPWLGYQVEVLIGAGLQN